MALPVDQRTGNGEGNPCMQPANGLWDPEDDIPIFDTSYIMQAGNDLWNPEDGFNFNEIFTNLDIMQPANGLWNPENNFNFNGTSTNPDMMRAAIGMPGTARTASNHINSNVTNWSDHGSHSVANIPRGRAGMEGILALVTPPFPVADSNIEPQHLPSNTTLAENGKGEPEYVTYPKTPHVTKCARKNSGPSSEEWKKWKPEIHKFYMENNYTLKKTKEEMAEKGFQAELPMYKRRIKYWGWKKYELDKDRGNLTKRARGKVPASTLREENSQPNSSRGTTVTVLTPPRLPYTQFSPAHFSMGISAPMSKTEFDKILTAILAKVTDLYASYPAQKKWKVEKQREVEEDIHDDLLVGVAASLRNYTSLSPEVGYKGFQKALRTLEKVVGVGEGADCGLFSLPAIWVSFLRMVRNQRPDWAREFLLLASKLAIDKFGCEHPFAQVLLNIQQVWRKEPGQLEEVVFTAYRRCIADVKKELGPLNLTYLSLWGDYVVYLDGRSTNETQAVVDEVRSVIKIIEEEKESDGGQDGDYTLELFGLTLYVLQSAPTMADEAEKVAEELLLRVNQRRVKAGGKLEGNLFITWKDLRQTLGTFCQEKEDYHRAIGYLEDFLSHEIVDERDALALEKLEKCYLSLGRDYDARKVWQRRMDSSQKLLQKTETEPGEGEEVMNDHEERDNDDLRPVSEEEESSDATLADQVDESNGEDLEEDIADELGNSGVEIQLLEEQIAELEQRVKVLKLARRRGERL